MIVGPLLLLAGLGLLTALVGGRAAPRLWVPQSVTGAAAALGAAVWVLLGAGAWEWRAVSS